MPLPHHNKPTARRVLEPLRFIYLLEAPAGEPSSGPHVAYSLDYCSELIEQGWLVTGPYVLDPAAALQAQQEIIAGKMLDL